MEEITVVARNAVLLGIGLNLLLLRNHNCHHEALQDRLKSALAILQQHGTASTAWYQVTAWQFQKHGKTLYHAVNVLPCYWNCAMLSNIPTAHSKFDAMAQPQQHGIISRPWHEVKCTCMPYQAYRYLPANRQSSSFVLMKATMQTCFLRLLTKRTGQQSPIRHNRVCSLPWLTPLQTESVAYHGLHRDGVQ